MDGPFAGYVWVADEAAPGSGYNLRAEPRTYIGPGRPLGFRYDSAGNLIVCDSLKVGGALWVEQYLG